MHEDEVKEVREIVELLRASGVTEFEMDRPDLKLRLKFACEAPAAAAPSVDMGQLAQLFASARAAAPAPVPVAPTTTGGTVSPTPISVSPIGDNPIPDPDAGLYIVKSPLVGTFYNAPSPGSPAFVSVGETVSMGKVLCIVEAMKIMNEIESDAAGTIVKVFVETGKPVEYGQALFGIRK